MSNRAEANIDLTAIAANVKKLKATAGTELMAVVKADAYGHGLVPVAKAALNAGASWLGVALVEEAHSLRAAGSN
jgi:alanine racemase